MLSHQLRGVSYRYGLRRNVTYWPGVNCVWPSASETSLASFGIQTPSPSEATAEKVTSFRLSAIRLSSRYFSIIKYSDLKRDCQCFCKLEANSLSDPRPVSTTKPCILIEFVSLSYALSTSVRSLSNLARWMAGNVIFWVVAVFVFEGASWSSLSTIIISKTKLRSSSSEKDNLLPLARVARMLSDNPSSFGIFQSPPLSTHWSTSVP